MFPSFKLVASAAALACAALLAAPASAADTASSKPRAQTAAKAKTPARTSTAAKKQQRNSRSSTPARRSSSKAAGKAAQTAEKPSFLQVNPWTGADAPVDPLPGVTDIAFPAPPMEVFTGVVPCELGTVVTITQDAADPFRFHLTTNRRHSYQMRQVPTTTGAARLEDKNAGVAWLQLNSKSMLLDQRKGVRLATECRNPQQTAHEQELRQAPASRLFD